MPRIGDYRGALEAQASQAIGVPVRIGAISARSDSLFPTFELRDVVLHDAQQREALRLARVVASVSPRSLWGLNFEQLYIERPELDVRLDAQGKLHVAGLHVSNETSGETRGADWFFSQREFAIEGGTVRWTDERRGVDPLLLSDVNFVTRNGPRSHLMRLDATPPAGWGERFTLRGRFRQPLLSVRSGNWQSWSGTLYAELPHMNVQRLGRYMVLDARIREADGALRLWADIDDGQVHGATADLALKQVDVSLGETLAPLILRNVTGRLAGQRDAKRFEFSTQNLQFDTTDGLRWPGGNLWFERREAEGRNPEQTALRADRLDLGALALIANRLPLDKATHQQLTALAPRGLMERIDANWQGPPSAPERYQARGRVVGLSLASQPAPPGATHVPAPGQPPRPDIGVPGVRAATIDFDATHEGGKATVAIAQGALEFPGVFEDPLIPIDQLQAQTQWKIDGKQLQMQVNDLRFANADAQGEGQLSWRSSDPAAAPKRTHHPGVLDLKGKLTRADGTRVYRYLPLDIPKHTRDYVRDAVQKGSASTVDFRVRGDLYDMPFADPRQGEFRIAAQISDATYAYVPRDAGAHAALWPALTGVSGELVFERAGMQVRNAHGRLAGAPGIEILKADAQIADLGHHAPLLTVDAQAKGPPGELLHVGAPLLGTQAESAAKVRTTGSAEYTLKLSLPIEAVEKTKVQASVVLGGNEVQLSPELPPLTQARGTLSFTETGFQLTGVQARLAGGDMRIEGRGRYAGAGAPEMGLRAQGTLNAEGLRGLREPAWLASLAQKASGSTAYTATFGLREGVPEFSLNSSLQGLALTLPAPLAKSADASTPLRIESKLLPREGQGRNVAPLHDQLTLELGSAASATYVRDVSGSEPRVLRGGIGVGLPPGEGLTLPERGVLANIHLAHFDADAWRGLAGKELDAGEGASQGYLPSLLAVRAQTLGVAGRTLHNVVLGGTRDGTLWRANVDADELSGYAEYRQAQAGRLHARLARLRVAPSEAPQVESLLDAQPGTLPALDIVIDDFELNGRHLGRAEIDAVNRGGAGREWRLNKLSLTTPEARFSAQGTWAALPGSDQRRTAMGFKLEISDAGALLTRFGMKDVLRRGNGRLEGDVEWRGSPFSLDYPSMNGQLHLDVESGQFLKADPGLAKLLGVLSLQALPRRLTLDFRDVFSTGFVFDFVRGDARIHEGTATTNNLQMKGVNAAVLMDGSANIARETQNLRVVVVPEINAGTAALVATAINPAIGLGTFLAQAILSRPLIAAATQEFQIDGTWADPKITKVPRRTEPPESTGR